MNSAALRGRRSGDAAAPRARGSSSTTTASCASTTPGTSSTPTPPPRRAETLDAVRAGIPAAHAAGVTGVHDKDGARGAPEAFAALREAGELTLRVWQSVPDADPARGSYVKAFMDGTLGSRTALLIGGGGMRLMGPEGLAAVIRDAAAAGMPVAVHAIGDLANREALDAFEATEDAVAAARAAPPRRARPVRARRRHRALRPPRRHRLGPVHARHQRPRAGRAAVGRPPRPRLSLPAAARRRRPPGRRLRRAGRGARPARRPARGRGVRRHPTTRR